MPANQSCENMVRLKLRWYQFSLRTLLLVVVLASVGFSWFAVNMKRAAEQRAEVNAIRKLGGRVTYDGKKYVPDLLRWLLGEDFFDRPQDVDFRGGQVTDAAMVSLEGLSGLTMLGIWDTQVSDEGFSRLGKLRRLRHLFCVDNPRITAVGISHIRKLTHLEDLALVSMRIDNVSLKLLEGLHNLRTLDLTGTPIGDDGLQHLEGLTRIESLELDDTCTGDAGLVYLKQLVRLETLWLRNTQVTGVGFVHLKGLPCLREVDLIGSAVTDDGLATIAQCSQLAILNLENTGITDAALVYLERMSNLSCVSLRDTKVTEARLKRFKEEHPAMKVYPYLPYEYLRDEGGEQSSRAAAGER